jgi:indole-3-glycerol phosphate synthase
MERALRIGSKLIGVNNRNLKILRTDLWVTESLAPMMPKDRQLVAENGLYRPPIWIGCIGSALRSSWSAIP